MMIRHFCHENPDNLTDAQWYERYNDVMWLLKTFYPYMIKK